MDFQHPHGSLTASKGSDSLLWPQGVLHTNGPQAYLQAKPTCKIKTNPFKVSIGAGRHTVSTGKADCGEQEATITLELAKPPPISITVRGFAEHEVC